MGSLRLLKQKRIGLLNNCGENKSGVDDDYIECHIIHADNRTRHVVADNECVKQRKGWMMKETQMIPKDFSAAVKDIKLAILQARARAARVSNVEALQWEGQR